MKSLFTDMKHNIKSFYFSWLFLMAAVVVQAQGPNNSGTYYKNADGKSGAALKTALYNIVSPHTNIGYDGLYEAYKKTDVRADGKLRDWYSNATNYTHDNRGTNTAEGAGWNREHCVPQSWFGSGTPKSDVVQVIPTDCYVNNRRSNYPMAEVGSVKWSSKNNYSKVGSCKTAGYSGDVFEPNDEIKGDIARIYFYMVTCYENNATSWGHSVFTSSKYPGIESWYLDMLMRWSKQDPVDDVELARNQAVWDVQGNRNPFVDYPGLEEYIWGTKTDQQFCYDDYDGGGTPDVVAVEQPLFSPESGSYADQVVVSMTTATEGAAIYYTTDNSNATQQSKLYKSPITLTETTTLKAIAVKDGVSSYQTLAVYTITNGSGDEKPVEGLIELNNNFFGTNFDGALTTTELGSFTGTQNGITIVYAKGDGANQYINDSQIRMYQKNKLTVSVAQGGLTELEFLLANNTSKKLEVSTGQINGLTWTGSVGSVTFNVNDGSGNMQLSGIKVKTSQTLDIQTVKDMHQPQGIVWTLSGQRVQRTQMKTGIYVTNGKKYVVK